MKVWSWLTLAPVHALVSEVRTPAEMEVLKSFAPPRPLQLSESISRACAANGLHYPTEDRLLLAFLRESGFWVDPMEAPRGAIMGAPDGRVGMRSNRGVIESTGVGLCLVDWTPERYTDAWIMPGVLHVGWEGAA